MGDPYVRGVSESPHSDAVQNEVAKTRKELEQTLTILDGEEGQKAITFAVGLRELITLFRKVVLGK